MATTNYSRHCLLSELNELSLCPLEGFQVLGVADEDITQWRVAVFGPSGSVYEEGCFELHLKFPHDYPFSPPRVWFQSQIWHPNVYDSGEVCLSTLIREQHMYPGMNQNEHWKAGHRVRTVLLSLLCLLAEPNEDSAANLDAGQQYKDWKKTGDPTFLKFVQQCVKQSRKEASGKGIAVPVPTTAEEEKACISLMGQLCLGKKESPQDDAAASDSDDTDPLEDFTPPGSPLAS